MGNMATENAAGNRIEQLLDAGSFVEIGGAVTEQQISTCRKRKLRQTVSLPVME